MFILPYQTSLTSYQVIFLLLDENLERMREHDPAGLLLANLGEPFTRLRLEGIAVGYASPAEAEEFTRRANEGEAVADIISWLYRGWKVKPEDHDGPGLSILIKKGDTVQ